MIVENNGVKSKAEKFSIIEEIITSCEVGNQDELLRLMAARGVVAAQASLSRYLKQMKVLRMINERGNYVYQMPNKVEVEDSYVSGELLSGGFSTTVEFSGNIVVIHTRPGYASSLASEIDGRARSVIIGTVAGDDTIFAVKKEELDQRDVEEVLSRIIPSIKKI
jgi:transcriptional regulator of arginine metabolism